MTAGLFGGTFMQSGTVLNVWSLAKNEKSTAFLVGSKCNITTYSTLKLVEELRKVDSFQLQIVANSIGGVVHDMFSLSIHVKS